MEEVKPDMDNHKIIVVGKKADPIKILQIIQNKYSQNAQLISPKPKPKPNPNPKPSNDNKSQNQVKSIVLRMYMHCEACGRDIKKFIERMTGKIFLHLYMNSKIYLMKISKTIN